MVLALEIKQTYGYHGECIMLVHGFIVTPVDSANYQIILKYNTHKPGIF